MEMMLDQIDDRRKESEIFVVLCASGFNHITRARSALMFATLAATAECRTILYAVQECVDIMVKGAIEKMEKPNPNTPTLSQRLQEALDAGVEILCCTQTMANKGITENDLIEGVKPAGAMTLIDLATKARGVLSF
jgi:predicted peroxiredoxin